MLKRSTYAWTADDEARLKDLASSGLYLRRIALRLKRSEKQHQKTCPRAGRGGKEHPTRDVPV